MSSRGGSPNNESLDREFYDLWRLFSKVRRAVWKASSRELSKYGITPEQAGVLYVVHNVIPDASQTEISRQLLIEHHTISGIVQRMESKGLVKRKVDQKRKNAFRITVTKKGDEAYRHALKRRSVHNVIGALSEEERRQLKAILDKLLAKSLEELEQFYKSPFSASD